MLAGTPEDALLLECPKCGSYGRVEKPAWQEWTRDKPYRWNESERVLVWLPRDVLDKAYRAEQPKDGKAGKGKRE